MGRVLVGLLFAAGLVAFAYVLVTGSYNAGPAVVAAGDSDVEVAAAHDSSVARLQDLVDKSIDNAKRAEELADEIDQAIELAADTSGRVDMLADDNEAARTSVRASLLAADDARSAAIMMRNYAQRMEARLQNTDSLVADAREISEVVESVERTREKVAQAHEQAIDAQRDLNAAEADLHNARVTARNDVGQPVYEDRFYEERRYADRRQPSSTYIDPDAETIILDIQDDEPYVEPAPSGTRIIINGE
ncbi:hypothetical protein [Parvularcula sp. LCG005]|uniref:hypothetical protein n=1 Tax=Parvularcula sp. LCG005 TaxID=3078805 RepID=UPI002942503E|nr:hypothetical protein [Parvularcula sp. LCG005]WOI54742.1 hypothetical protein RUI03_06985 [Parvularcula sp. LCG005]